MKKIFIIGLFCLIAGNVFCQTLDKEEQKKVQSINKQAQKRLDNIVKHPSMSAEEKKDRISAGKRERDAQLAEVLSPAQVDAVKAKDPVNWEGANKKVDNKEKSKIKEERDQKLKEVDKQSKELENQQDDLEKKMADLKKKQKDLDKQQVALKQKRKEINSQYKL